MCESLYLKFLYFVLFFFGICTKHSYKKVEQQVHTVSLVILLMLIFAVSLGPFYLNVLLSNIVNYSKVSVFIFVCCSRPRATSNTDSPQSPSLGTPVNSLGELIPPENSPRPKTPDTEMPLFPIKVNANELSLEEEQLVNERKGRCLGMLI